MGPAIETHGLTRDFGQFRAVNGIDLAVPAGSFYGFLGPNGAGKSTTIKCLTGLLKPTAGSMRILGLDPLAEPVAVKRRIGVVPEDLALFDRLTAHETLTFVARGGTIFLTSHILEIVERLSTHIGVIAQGRLVAQAPIAELRETRGRGQTLEELFIGLVGADVQPQADLDWF